MLVGTQLLNKRCRQIFLVFVAVFMWPVAAIGQDCTDGLNTKSDPADLLTCVKELGKVLRTLQGGPAVPSGVVAAFDLSSGCPAGWKDMGPTWRGHALVAAVNNANDPFGFRRTGGSETHKLTIDEMPTHAHDSAYALSGSPLPWSNKASEHPIPTPYKRKESKYDWSKGGNKAHNNMPPFIALYFCKKI